MRWRRVLEAVDSTAFWFGVAFAAIVIVFAYAHSIRSADIAHNAETLRRQQTALSYLCETARVLDAIFVQSAAIDASLMRDPSLAPSVVEQLRKRRAVLRTAHHELSDTRACRQIE